MPLYDVTNKDVLVTPADCAGYDLLKCLERKLHPITHERCWKTVRDAVESVKPSKASKLTWTRMAALFGEKNLQPSRHVDHLWDSVISAVGDDKECLQAIGALLRAVVAERPETWLVYRQETGDLDPITGKKITISSYWIDENYVPPETKQKKKAKAPSHAPVGCGMSLAEQLEKLGQQRFSAPMRTATRRKDQSPSL